MIKLGYMILNNMRKNEKIATHFHNDYELTYYFSGKGYCLYGDNINDTIETKREYVTEYLIKKRKLNNRVNFGAFSCLIIPPNVPHYKLHTEKSSFISLVFSVENCDVPKDIIYSALSSNAQALFTIIIEEMKNRKENYIAFIENILNCLFIELERKKMPTRSVNDFIMQSVQYIDNYFLTDINFIDYCSANGYSIDHFRHKFKDYTSQSPKEYLLNKRMNYAKQQLETSNIPINILSELCLFSDYMQFSTYFKKLYGVSPAKYRKLTATK